MKAINRKLVWFAALALVLLFALTVSAAPKGGDKAPAKGPLMKTPSPMEKDKAPEPAKEEAKEGDDNYYNEEQAGGVHYEDEEESDTLDKELIQKTIGGGLNGIRYCYEKELTTNQSLKGRLFVNFQIQLDGKVSDLKVVDKQTTLKSKKVTQCVLDIVKNFKFAARKKGEPIEINYPFNFQPKKEQ